MLNLTRMCLPFRDTVLTSFKMERTVRSVDQLALVDDVDHRPKPSVWTAPPRAHIRPPALNESEFPKLVPTSTPPAPVAPPHAVHSPTVPFPLDEWLRDNLLLEADPVWGRIAPIWDKEQ